MLIIPKNTSLQALHPIIWWNSTKFIMNRQITASLLTTAAVVSLSVFVSVGQALSQAWTNAEKDIMRKSCIDSAVKSGKISTQKATTYCSCVVDAAASRYTTKQVAANPSKIVSDLQKSGVVTSCIKKAGIN
jgi:hypothetical protein